MNPISAIASMSAGFAGAKQSTQDAILAGGSAVETPLYAVGSIGLSTPARVAEGEAAVGGRAELQEYGGPGGGHHVPAKSAFQGAGGYDPLKAPAIPNDELARLGVDHSLVTGAQQWGYRALAQSGEPLTWKAVEKVEADALVRGGMDTAAARATVQNAIRQLRQSGVATPTRIPWSK
jgi:hypothetical protein